MKPPSNVKTPAQYIASLPADRAKTIATVRAIVNKHIPGGYDECLVWGTILPATCDQGVVQQNLCGGFPEKPFGL